MSVARSRQIEAFASPADERAGGVTRGYRFFCSQTISSSAPLAMIYLTKRLSMITTSNERQIMYSCKFRDWLLVTISSSVKSVEIELVQNAGLYSAAKGRQSV